MNDLDNIKNILIEELNDYLSIEYIGKSTGVKGDIGLYGSVLVINLRTNLRTNIRTINWEKLKKIQSRITNELPNVSRVLIEI